MKGHNCKHLMKINTPGINIWKIKCVVFAVCICGKMNKKVTIFINIYIYIEDILPLVSIYNANGCKWGIDEVLNVNEHIHGRDTCIIY